MLVSEIWKEKVLPLLKKGMLENCGFKSHLVLFHECLVVNLLETLLYHRTAVDAAEDALLELIDYAYRKLQRLVSKQLNWIDSPQTKDEVMGTTKDKEFERQYAQFDFKAAMSCISIIRYISDQIKHLTPSVLRHLIIQNDTLMACVVLIEDRPWLRKSIATSEREMFEDGQWIRVPPEGMSKMPKIEGQVWIAIYNLFLSPECASKYEITDYRKNMILRLRKYMNELVLDQIPNLVDLLKTLEQMSIMNTNAQAASNPFVVQQMPEIRTKILEGKDWKEIARYQLEHYFTKAAENQEFELMVKFADIYSSQNAEILTEGFKCANCFKPASQRCARCKTVWYCSKECQVDHFKKAHKAVCKIMAEKLAEKSDKASGIIKKGEIVLEKKNSGADIRIQKAPTVPSAVAAHKAEKNIEEPKMSVSKKPLIEVLESNSAKAEDQTDPQKDAPLGQEPTKESNARGSSAMKELWQPENPLEELD